MAPLRPRGALVVLTCAVALTLGAEPALGQAPATEPSPTRLWKEYPLEPLDGRGESRTVLRIRPTAVGESSSPNRLLLIGGLALFVLVLSDTVFLALSSRVVRRSP